MDLTEWDQMTREQKRAAVNVAAAEEPHMRRCWKCDRQVAVTTDQVGVRFGAVMPNGAVMCSDDVIARRAGEDR